MLPKKYRAKRSDIEETIKKGIIIPSMFLYAKISKKEKEKPSFAIIISKKTEKNSVGRHLIKRRINAVLENNLKNINPNFKKALIFFVKKSKKPISYYEIEKNVKEIIKKAGL